MTTTSHASGRLRTAFTLTELTVAVLLTGIVAGMAGLRFAAALDRNRATYAAQRVIQDLAWVRHSARSSNRSITVTFNVANSRYTVSPLLTASGATVSQTVNLAEGPAQATLESADLGGDALLVFNGFGLPDSGGSLVVQSGGASRTITIDAASGTASTP